MDVERWFEDGLSSTNDVDNLRKQHTDPTATILDICRSHASVKSTSEIVSKLVALIGDASRIDWKEAVKCNRS